MRVKTLRIIAGKLRGRQFHAPTGQEVRPTTDRIRESIFARLSVAEGDRVLDLFAGSGGLGIEAISRGASEVVFVEKSYRVASTLKKNLQSLGIGKSATVIRSDARKALSLLTGPFDLILLDPPYGSPDGREVLEHLGKSSLFHSDSILVFESSRRKPPMTPEGLEILDTREMGDTLITRFVPGPGEELAR